MKTFAKIVHRTYVSYLPTAFPAHYYGMPNGRIYLVFSRFYEADYGETGLEFVFAEHKDFKFDYETETILPWRGTKKQTPIFAEHVDHPHCRYNIFSVNRQLNSYGEAHIFLNDEALKMRSLVS
ncbi:hypothetical protein OU798_14920 [Prolixibacteraceae bacterium Z1-6]|uniref:Uncharacterized protein n=1 Tax=Draconibacterium aestuarii TaxID=2998507 RepID=A0A9X3F7A7_9BACT|nr:hypothetical protein [Prolixibacteraceae bacterium Z1-6]